MLLQENNAGCDGSHIVHECAWSQRYFFLLLHTPCLLFAVSTFPVTLGLIWRRNSWQKWWWHIVVQGHQIIFWVTVCASGLDISVTLSVCWLNVILKFARDLLVLLSVSPCYLSLSLAYLWKSCVTYCLPCRCALYTVQTDFIVFLLSSSSIWTGPSGTPVILWAGLSMVFAAVVLSFIWPLCVSAQRSCCCIEVCAALCVINCVLVSKYLVISRLLAWEDPGSED